MELRSASEQDLGAIGQLGYDNWVEVYRGMVDQKFLDDLTPEERSDHYGHFLEEKGGGIFVITEGERLLGFAAYKPDEEIEGCLLLDSLHVAKAARGKGVGSRLIQTVWDLAAERGLGKVSISAVRANEKARALYRKRGAEHFDFHVSTAFPGYTVISEKLVWHI